MNLESKDVLPLGFLGQHLSDPISSLLSPPSVLMSENSVLIRWERTLHGFLGLRVSLSKALTPRCSGLSREGYLGEERFWRSLPAEQRAGVSLGVLTTSHRKSSCEHSPLGQANIAWPF